MCVIITHIYQLLIRTTEVIMIASENIVKVSVANILATSLMPFMYLHVQVPLYPC